MTKNELEINSKVTEVARQIEAYTVERYTKRFQDFGDDPRTLGWDTDINQRIRFKAVTDLVDLNSTKLADIGCGFCDFYTFLMERGVQLDGYLGIDINPNLLKVAQQRYPDIDCEKRNLLVEPYCKPVADYGVMLGLLNFRLHGVENYQYAKEMIKVAFSAVRKGLIVDFLSFNQTPDYPEESFVFYYKPERMLHFAFSLTPNVVLKHDYAQIPQKEFMLLLRKEPCE